ncbi:MULTISPECIES: HAMP domain-containing sensor histidine kinase [unclassified Clostridium]|uniref:sensor histidine kinase n=1 Tax=unclassified Clostridium TaxID=2614128 RepID=UPI0013F0EF5B|nr:sensor histidine kinase [Clostridium botulinum]MBN1055405.1 sensor histidine kinase [Clostridium botulinum]NFS29932.1 HAMP domain-containing histidine kinase [Clostridium botulinum]NFS55361.1 HAMP domain-containing histidine kinase [Clostridium botulinum]NFT18461.1 HAMP domain-containing histidine kinase [Clostridium botulinum]
MLTEGKKGINKKLILLIITNVISFYIIFRLNIFMVNNVDLAELTLVKDIKGINYIIGFISVFCCFLYYYLYEENYFFMFSLIYLSIYSEFLIVDFLTKHINISALMHSNSSFVGFASIFRTLLLYLTIFNQNKVTKGICKNRFATVIFVLISNVLFILMDLNIMKYYSHVINIDVLMIIKNIINLATYLLILEVCIKYFKEKEFNYFITFASLSVMFLSRILLVKSLYNDQKMMYILNRCLLALGFFIIIISVFIEIITKSKENKELSYEVVNQKNEMYKLKEEEEMRSQFFANISHELRTPLNIIISSFQLLRMYNYNEEEFLKYYNKYENTISQNCSRMLRLINNIIDVTKFDAGCFKMNFVNCEIISLVENITLSIAEYEKARKRNIIFDTDCEFLEIKCDPENMERAILNLLSNAIKFTSDNGNIFVSIESQNNDECLSITIKDDGIGIPKDFRKSVFERFVQVDKSFRRNVEGSGIGLSLVKYIVNSHNGEINLKDNEEKGCEFIINLPNVKIEDELDDIEFNLHKKDEIDSKILIELSDIK